MKAKIRGTSTLARSSVPEVNNGIIKPFFPGLSPHTPLLVWSLIRWPREPKNLPEPAEDCLLEQDLKVKCSSRLHKHSTGKGKCLITLNKRHHGKIKSISKWHFYSDQSGTEKNPRVFLKLSGWRMFSWEFHRQHLSTYFSSLNRSFYASAAVLLVRHPVVTRIGDNFITEREWVGMFI